MAAQRKVIGDAKNQPVCSVSSLPVVVRLRFLFFAGGWTTTIPHQSTGFDTVHGSHGCLSRGGRVQSDVNSWFGGAPEWHDGTHQSNGDTQVDWRGTTEVQPRTGMPRAK